MLGTLTERFEQYQNDAKITVIRRLPIVIRCQIRSFSRLTREINTIANPDLLELSAQTLLYSIQEIQGAVFGYAFNDEINFILKTEQDDVWFGNDKDKIAAVSASLCTLNFIKYTSPALDLIGDAIFDATVFPLPNISETVNYLIWRQNTCHNKMAQEICQAELGQKLDKKTVSKLLKDRTAKEKLELLFEYSDFSIDALPNSYTKGIGVYKVPTLIGEVNRNKWTLNTNLEYFHQDKELIENIIQEGRDIFKAPFLIKE